MFCTHSHLAYIDSIPDPYMCHGGPVIILNKSSHYGHYFTHKSCQSVCVHLHTGMILKENNTLKELRLGACGLQPEGLEEFIKGVQVNTKLETLDLGENTIDNKRASCLGKKDIIQ